MSVHIRSATVDDARAVQAIYAPIVLDTTISFEDVPPSTDEIAARIAATLQSHPYLVAERDGDVVGYAYAGPHRSRAAYRRSVDVSAYVADDARQAGIGGTLYRHLLAELKERGFHAAFAGIALPNAASVGLHESVGFRPVGIYREVGFKFDR